MKRFGLLFCVIATGCGPDGLESRSVHTDRAAPRSAAPRSTVLSITSDSPDFRIAAGRVAMRVVEGQTRGIVLRVDAAGRDVNALTLSVNDLVGSSSRIPAERAQWFRLYAQQAPPRPAWAIRFVDPALWDDRPLDIVVPASAPLGGLPTSMRQGQWLAVLVEIEFPESIPAGLYTGALKFWDGEALLTDIPIDAEVLPFELPRVDGPRFIASLAWNRSSERVATGASGLGELASAATLLARHGVTPYVTGATPDLRIDASGALVPDWTSWDAVQASVEHAVRSIDPQWKPPVCIELERAMRSGVVQDGVESFTTLYLREFATHLRRRDLLDRAWIEIPPESSAEATIKHIRAIGAIARQLEVRTLSRFHLHGTPAETTQRLADSGAGELIDIHCPPATYCDASPSPHKWYKLTRPPFSGSFTPGAPSATARVIAWQAERHTVDTVDLGGAEVENSGGLLHSGAAFGVDGLLATMRLKRFFDGVQDIALLRLIRENGLTELADDIQRRLCRPALIAGFRNHVEDPAAPGWDQRDEVWTLARSLMVDALALRAGGVDAGNLQLKLAVGRRRLAELTSGVRLTVEGVRMRSGSDIGAFEIECLVRIENQADARLRGVLRFEALPFGYKPRDAGRVAVDVDPWGVSRAILLAQSDGVSWDHAGKTELPVVMVMEDGERAATVARLAVLASAPVSQNVTIDGDLSEWAPGAGNVAGAFLSIRDGMNGAAPPRSVETRVLGAHDQESLYFAVTAPVANDSPLDHAIGNEIHCDEGIPVGNDAIELLFDPTNAGTHDAGDLYRIILTPGGMLAERGVSREGQRRESWATDIRFASRVVDGRWQCEVRMPQSALRRDGPLPWLVGFNVTHFDPTREEYRTWSGARWNSHDPMSLGHLLLPSIGVQP